MDHQSTVTSRIEPVLVDEQKIWSCEEKRREFIHFIAIIMSAFEEIQDYWNLGKSLHTDVAGVNLYKEDSVLHEGISDIISKYIVVRLCALTDNSRVCGHDTISIRGMEDYFSEIVWQSVIAQMEREGQEEIQEANKLIRKIRNNLIAHNNLHIWKMGDKFSFSNEDVKIVIDGVQAVLNYARGLHCFDTVINIKFNHSGTWTPSDWWLEKMNKSLVMMDTEGGNVNIDFSPQKASTLTP